MKETLDTTVEVVEAANVTEIADTATKVAVVGGKELGFVVGGVVLGSVIAFGINAIVKAVKAKKNASTKEEVACDDVEDEEEVTEEVAD